MSRHLQDYELRLRVTANHAWAWNPGAPSAHAPGRPGLSARLEREVDPAGTLLPDELARRVEHARKAHYARRAYRAAKNRRLR